MNLQENILRVKELMGLNEQFGRKDPLEPQDQVDLGDDQDYSTIGLKEKKLVGKSTKTNKWEYIGTNFPKYKNYLDLIEKASYKPEEQGVEIDGVNRDGEPLKFKLGTLTSEDINKVYKYSLEYQKAFNQFRKTSPLKFCEGDLFDISLSNSDVNKIRKCGVPSFENIVPSKFVDNEQKTNFIETIYFLVTNPNDPKVPEIKKRLGITS